MRRLLELGVSVLVAVVLWIFVVTVIGPEYEKEFKDIPVTFVGETSSDLMIRNEEGHKVTLKLSGNRAELLKLSTSNITVVIDRTQITEAGSHVYRYDVQYPANVTRNAVIVQSMDPAGIKLDVDRVTTADIPVKVTYDGPTPDNFVRPVDPELKPIRIKGPEQIVNQIAYAKVAIQSSTIPEDDIVGNFPYQFYDKNNQVVDATAVTPSPENRTVSITYPVRITKDLTLDVSKIYGGGVTASNSSCELSQDKITVSGKQADLKNLTVLQLGVIDLSTMRESGTIVFNLDEALSQMPGDLKVVEGDPEVIVTVQLPELLTKELYVTQFKIINPPEGSICNIRTSNLKVTVRGSKENVSKISASDITIVVDLSNFEGLQEDEDAEQQYFKGVAVIKDKTDEVAVLSISDDGSVLVLVEDEAVVAARNAQKNQAVVTPVKN